MKICIIAPYFTPFVRGNEYGLAKSLSKKGHKVEILSSKSRAPREKMVSGIYKEYNNHKDFNVKYLTTLGDFFENPIVINAFFEVIKNDYDVLLIQEDYSNACHMAFFAARLKGIPAILSTERNYSPIGLKKIGLFILDRTLNRILRDYADVYTAHCSSAKEYVQKRLNVHRDIKVLHVGIDCAVFNPIEKPKRYLTTGRPILLTVSRLHHHKGLMYLVKAMQRVISEVPGARLYILGKGPQEADIFRLGKSLGINDSIEFIKSAIPNNEMPHVYSCCDIYLQPSTVEPYGIAVVEAMACGKPVIASNVGGMKDTVAHGVTGFLVRPRDASGLAEAIIKLAKDNNMLEIMGQKARKRAVDLFDWDKIASEYQSLIYSVMKHKKVTPVPDI